MAGTIPIDLGQMHNAFGGAANQIRNGVSKRVPAMVASEALAHPVSGRGFSITLCCFCVSFGSAYRAAELVGRHWVRKVICAKWCFGF